MTFERGMLIAILGRIGETWSLQIITIPLRVIDVPFREIDLIFFTAVCGLVRTLPYTSSITSY
jgi:hypothetical protein